jgi:hypothetical protein
MISYQLLLPWLAKLVVLQTAIQDELVARGFTTGDGMYNSKLLLLILLKYSQTRSWRNTS